MQKCVHMVKYFLIHISFGATANLNLSDHCLCTPARQYPYLPFYQHKPPPNSSPVSSYNLTYLAGRTPPSLAAHRCWHLTARNMANYNEWEFNNLKAELKRRGLSAGGKKVQLIARLRRDDKSKNPSP